MSNNLLFETDRYLSNVLYLPHGKLQSVIDWCEQNCEGHWQYTDSWLFQDKPGYTFLFKLEKDYMAFSLVYE